jgi:hypothetical protein
MSASRTGLVAGGLGLADQSLETFAVCFFSNNFFRIFDMNTFALRMSLRAVNPQPPASSPALELPA